MGFPSYGSWISGSYTVPSNTQTTTLSFVCDYTAGSSLVEYAIYKHDLATLYTDFTTPTVGSNSIVLSSIDDDFKIIVRMIGYPEDGFNPVFKHLEVFRRDNVSSMQIINVGSDVKLPTTLFDRAYVKPYGSFYWNLTGSVSSDGGTSWTPIPLFGQEFALTSTLGSEPLVVLRDVTGSVVLTEMDVYFHTSDVK